MDVGRYVAQSSTIESVSSLARRGDLSARLDPACGCRLVEIDGDDRYALSVLGGAHF
jgi:hypothetical protein